MKKITFLILMLVTTLSIAQEKEKKPPQDLDKKHELKLNAFGLLAFEWLDVSYEYLIDDESSFGSAILIGFNSDTGLDEYRKFSITPYYRRYFSNKFARGFFVEGFGMLHSYENRSYYYDNSSNWIYDDKTNTEFALGISIGGKFVSKSGFSTEIYIGLGRSLGGDDSIEAVGRGGISLGYRF